MDENLVQLLSRSGLTQKESQVYLALLELGQADVTEIAKCSGVKRTTVYVLLDILMEKGYASQVKATKINTFQPIDPAVLYSQLKTTSSQFGQMLPFLQSLRNKGKKKPRIHYIETLEGIAKINDDMGHANEACFISSFERIEKYLPDSVDRWVKNFKKGTFVLRVKNLVPNSKRELELAKIFMEAGQEVRMLNTDDEIKMDFALFNNKLAITLFDEAPFMLLIESQELVDSLKPVFENSWKMGKPIK